jgi:hypothetical protein
MSAQQRPRIGVVVPGDPAQLPAHLADTRWSPVCAALEHLEVDVRPVWWHVSLADRVREQLRDLDAAIVWVNPLVDGGDRSALNELLIGAADRGVAVSAHPDTIGKLGTKEVLYATRDLPWGAPDTRMYRSWDELAQALPHALRSGPRVLKQWRGNDGNGVWKVQHADASGEVFVQQAMRGAMREQLTLSAFLDRCRPYFEHDGRIIDQPFQQRLEDGMVRCYLSQDRVVGFGQQYVTALLDPAPGEAGPPDPHPRLYYGAEQPEFQTLRRLMEGGWVAAMQQRLEIPLERLPVIWDADFLYGPQSEAGEDTYVLCEVNVNSVYPIPDQAFAPLAEAAVRLADSARAQR